MRHRLVFTLIILLSALVFACKKDKQDDNSPYFLHALKNNVNWSTNNGAYFSPYNTTLDTLNLYGNYKEEHLFIVIQKNVNGKYELNLSKTKFYTTVGQDALVSSYQLDNTATNSLNITEISHQNQFIKGIYTLTFKKIYGDNNYPSIITFSNGQFEAVQSIVI